MRLAQLEGKRVAIWGYGREGHAAAATLRERFPTQPLTLFCGAGEAPDADASLEVVIDPPNADALARFDVVIKSPGISAYKPELLDAAARGTLFTSGTALWFADSPVARVIGVTGTKGKSTTSAMIAHLARSLGVRTALAGNIGLPLLELRHDQAALWVVELSSFQTGEAGPLELGIITSLYEEHLDWHGTPERYVADKLRLVDVSRQLLVNATQPMLTLRTAQHPQRTLFGVADGWHVAGGQGADRHVEGAHIGYAAKPVFPCAALNAPGTHNALNACAALAALQVMGLDAIDAAPALATFQPLPHRLQPLGRRNDRDWINDSISTTPQATLAALQSLQERTVTVLVGGHDRGLDWMPFISAMRVDPVHAIVCMGANGARIASALRDADVPCPVVLVDGLAEAVIQAKTLTPDDGVVLMSPGAPSFDQFHDYAERGRCFTTLAGFDATQIAMIDGLGIQ